MICKVRGKECRFNVEEAAERIDHFGADVVDHDDASLYIGRCGGRGRGWGLLRPFFQQNPEFRGVGQI